LIRTFVLSLFLGLVSTSWASAQQQSSCADCHFANPQADPDPDHTSDWEMSPHGRRSVGCETCHGGDATKFESFLAHRGILASRNPASPVYRTNLPRTCGVCHTGPFVAFQRSRHFQLLEEGKTDGPTCSTCHGAVAARLLSSRALEKECEGCHGEKAAFPKPGFPVKARILHDQVQAVRELLSSVPRLLRRIDDQARRKQLEDAYEQAQVPLTEAVQAAHAFVFDQMEERLATAKTRSEALLDALANPK
jgi:Cytochrome c7 and related cytochrome c/Cytochrome c554 and c-prime